MSLKVLVSLDASAARAIFPNVVGPIEAAELMENGAYIVRQAFNAWAVIIDGEYRACCPARKYAERFAAKA